MVLFFDKAPLQPEAIDEEEDGGSSNSVDENFFNFEEFDKK